MLGRVGKFVSAVFFLTMVHYGLPATAQTSYTVPALSTWTLGSQLHYGFIVPHSRVFRPISQTNPWGVEVNVSKLSVTEKAWNVCNCYANVGLAFNYFNYQNPQILGNSYNLILYGEPFLSYTDPFFLKLKGGMGITYLDQVYDEADNPENVFYSAPISFILLLNVSLNYSINKKTFFKLAANYNHISNGGYKLPNKGINFPTVSAGIEYYLDGAVPVPRTRNYDQDEEKWIKYIRLFGNMRTVSAEGQFDEARELMAGIETGIIRRVSKINGLMVTLEASYDGYYKEKNIRRGGSYDHHVVSLLGGHTFIFGRFYLSQQFAYYLYRPYPANEHSFFQSYAVHYRLGKAFSIGGSLKAHAQVAEYMDIRVGIMF